MEDASIKLHKFEDEEGKHAFWHTSSHIMAEAIQKLFPGTKFGIGPAVENGFYYVIELPDGKILSENDFAAINNKMMEICRADSKLVRKDISKADALKLFKERGDEYKVNSFPNSRTARLPFTTRANSPTSARDRISRRPAM